MKLENLNGYANQFLITDKNRTTFQSYNSRIAEFNEETGLLKLYEDWDYSNTTRRHFKSFINEHTPFTYENKAQWLKEIENNPSIEVI
jgi:hypothetical protein